MARSVRVEFAGAVYHVMARGNERRAIFRDDRDRQRYLETLAEMVERFGVRLHVYCLMRNHYHLVLGTPSGNLSQAVGWLQVTYTVRFNRRHRRNGHLFQGRFKAQLVEADEYAQWVVAYVHLNPVRPRHKGEQLPLERAGELDAYRWSSHRDYAGLRRAPDWLSLDWQRYWGRPGRESTRAYRAQIARCFAQGEVANPWDKLRGGLVLGGEELWAHAQRLVADKPGEEERHWTVTMDRRQSRERVEELVATEADERIKIWLLVRLGGERSAAVGRRFGYRDGAGVAYVLRQVETTARADARLASRLAAAKKLIYSLQS